MTMKNLLTSQNLESTSTKSITIELANEGYGFGFSLATGEDGDSVIKYLIPDGIAEGITTADATFLQEFVKEQCPSLL